jgi:hypothetical protein
MHLHKWRDFRIKSKDSDVSYSVCVRCGRSKDMCGTGVGHTYLRLVLCENIIWFSRFYLSSRKLDGKK